MTRPELDPAILDRLMPDLVGHDRQPSAFLVYLFLWRHTHGAGSPEVHASLADIAEGTGLSKRSVQDALNRLVKRRLVGVTRKSVTSIASYTVRGSWPGGP